MTKKEKTHQHLIETAVRLFIRKRSSNVSLDEIADEADVARRTLFYHFSSKEALILEITEPVFAEGLAYLDKLSVRGDATFDDVSALCYHLWRLFGSRLNLLYTVDFEDFASLKALHGKYQEAYMDLFNRIGDLPPDLQNSRREMAAMIFRCFVPILMKVEGMDRPEERFARGLRGLVTGLSLS